MNATVKKLLAIAAGSAAATIVARAAIRRSRHFDYSGKIAIVTGGSRGLGLVLARKLVDRDVSVAIFARSQDDLAAAEAELRERGGRVMAVRCDVRRPEQVDAAVQAVRSNFGPIDLLFNIAGVIQVGPIDAMTLDDFHHAMDTNCWGTLHTILAVMPDMRARRWGRIVNVASIGGKRAVPHMLPYSASKFAQVGLSNGLRTELAKDGIYVTTACPSLMRTGSPRNAVFKGRNREEYTWFSISDSLPLLSMSAEAAADQLLQACQNGAGEILLRSWENFPIVAQSAIPGVTRALLTVANRFLPAMGGIGRQAARGYDSHSRWSPSWMTHLTEVAARENNQMRTHPLPNPISSDVP